MKAKQKTWRFSNCLLFAALDAIKNDKYVVIRKSHMHHRWPFCHYHFLTVPKHIIDEYAESFVPEAGDTRDFPPPLFKGHVKKGD